tara:strand:+ start:331 stop:528 length:198 start_codon:yes stop_codon:yes gene_type:complete
MEKNMENVTEHTVTLKVRSDVDPAELLDIMMYLRENIIEMVEQQCIECWVPEDEISVESKNEGGE